MPQQAPDPILGISDAFKACTHPDKLNLGVGAYRTDDLQPLVLDVVKKVFIHSTLCSTLLPYHMTSSHGCPADQPQSPRAMPNMYVGS